MSAYTDRVMNMVFDGQDAEKMAAVEVIKAKGREISKTVDLKAAEQIADVAKLIEAETKKKHPNASVVSAFEGILKKLAA